MEAIPGTQNPQSNDELTVTLFHAAMSRPESEREQFIQEACAGDGALRAEVCRLVTWEARMQGFLLTPIFPRERIDRPFAPGDLILRDRYRILREAGEGGMGVVFEALDTRLNWRVAVKCPRFEFRKRLTQEAAKSIRVHHPNVCRVFEIHTEETATGEVDFLTMEFLEGETLAARLAHAPKHWLYSGEGKLIAQQICAGLKAVHSAGIVHRDLKSANVMLTKDSAGVMRAVIMDFGIAQGTDLYTSQARGTPAYLAPELWLGQPATIRSDIYALGVLLYEMAAGRKPFRDGAEWRERLRTAPPPAPGDRAAALARCLAPRPEQRFAGVDQLEAALWPPSRRGFFYAAAGVAAVSAAGYAARESFFPASPVRLAILPPAAPPGGDTQLISGFLHDISYRVKSLRRSRRPLSVFSLAQTSADGITSPEAAGRSFAATHALQTTVQSDASGWTIAAALIETRSGGGVTPLKRWTRRTSASTPELAGQLFLLQSELVNGITAELRLRGAEPKRASLNRETYENYLRGIHYARVDYEHAAQAIPLFERVIAAAPQESLGYAGLAEALLGASYVTGDQSLTGQALTALAKAEQLDPDSAHVHLMSGRLNAAAGLWERALADFRRAAELEPHDAQAFIGIGYALLYPGRYEEAEAAFQAAFAAQPGYYKPHLEAGIFYWEISKPQDAERHWLEAVRLNPTHTRAKLNLAILYLKADRIAEAERQIQESLKLRRTLPALELLGDLQEQAGRYHDAIRTYEEALQAGPPEYKSFGPLAAVYRKVGREADAITALRQGLDAAEGGLPGNPRDPDRLAWCAFYHASLGDAGRARARAAEAAAVAARPAARVRTRLAFTYDTLGDVAAVLQTMSGAPRELLRDLGRDPKFSAGLRRDPRFIRMTQ